MSELGLGCVKTSDVRAKCHFGSTVEIPVSMKLMPYGDQNFRNHADSLLKLDKTAFPPSLGQTATSAPGLRMSALGCSPDIVSSAFAIICAGYLFVKILENQF
jgi:hypothetical protein